MDVPPHFHFTFRRMVEFADTDLAGIMHFANFFRFVESAEHAFFRSLGFPVHTTQGSRQQGWPRIEVSCRYLSPARFEQTLAVGLVLEEVRNTTVQYRFWVVGDDPARTLIATGACAIIHVELDLATHALRKAPIPDPLRAKLSALLAGPPAAR